MSDTPKVYEQSEVDLLLAQQNDLKEREREIERARNEGHSALWKIEEQLRAVNETNKKLTDTIKNLSEALAEITNTNNRRK